MLLIFFTVSMLMSVDVWLTNRKPLYILIAIISFVLMYATKETAILTWTALGIALAALHMTHPRVYVHSRDIPWSAMLIGAVLALSIHILFFTSFFMNPRGFIDSVLSPLHWFERAQSFHAQPFAYFIQLLFIHELGLILLATLALSLCIMKRVWSPRLTFLFGWTVTITIIYSSISYKTPWCIPNIILPLGLFAAFGMKRVWPALNELQRHASGVLIAIFAFISITESLQDSFGNPNRETRLSYAYLQSNESLDDFIGILHSLSLLHGEDHLPLQIVGKTDELLYVLTNPYAREFGDMRHGFPVYVNYQNSAEDVEAFLQTGDDQYVRAVFTYIQHVNQIDLFVRKDLWERYLLSDMVIRPVSISDIYDYRTN